MYFLDVEKTMHHNMLWFEKKETPTATSFMAMIGTKPDADMTFQIDAGDNAWGSWLQIIGEDDWPVGAKHGVFDRIGLTATEKAKPYVLQIAWGATGAAGLAAGDYTTEPILPAAVTGEAQPVIFDSDNIPDGNKVWARCLCPGEATGTMNFYFGGHIH